jgi:hypothetical protein
MPLLLLFVVSLFEALCFWDEDLELLFSSLYVSSSFVESS